LLSPRNSDISQFGNIFRLTPTQTASDVRRKLDKASADQRCAPLGPLLTLLESATSRTFRGEAGPFALDASRIVWFGTANKLDAVSEPIRSRFRIHHVQTPTRQQNLLVPESVWADLFQSQPWGARFEKRLQDAVVMLLTTLTPPRRAKWSANSSEIRIASVTSGETGCAYGLAY
jgi:hypothetical protein